MAITNQERVGNAMDLLPDGLRLFAERELKVKYGDRWATEVKVALAGRQPGQSKGDALRGNSCPASSIGQSLRVPGLCPPDSQ